MKKKKKEKKDCKLLGNKIKNRLILIASNNKKISFKIILSLILLIGNQKGMGQINFCNEAIPSDKQVESKLYNVIRVHVKAVDLSTIKARAAKYFPYIEEVLKSYGIPDDFKYLPIVESRLTSKALSHAGAYGYWQFMPETAKGMGLKVNNEIDERSDFKKSTVAACAYIKKLYSYLGNWTLTAAAYNCGTHNLRKSMTRQKVGNYYFLKLNPETGEYVYRIIAIKMMFENENWCRNIKPSKQLDYIKDVSYTVKVKSDNPVMIHYGNLEDYFNTIDLSEINAAIVDNKKKLPEETYLSSVLDEGWYKHNSIVEVRILEEITIDDVTIAKNTIIKGTCSYSSVNKRMDIIFKIKDRGVNDKILVVYQDKSNRGLETQELSKTCALLEGEKLILKIENE